MRAKFANFDWPADNDFPKQFPKSAIHVITVEWAWGPANNRQDIYYLSTDLSGTYWILWAGYVDDNNNFSEKHVPYSYGKTTEVSATHAANELLIAGWTGEVEDNEHLDRFHFVCSEGILNADEIEEAAEEVWGEEAVRNRQKTAKERSAKLLSELITAAADDTNLPAIHELGLRHFYGEGVEQSHEIAFTLWSKAAAAGYPQSTFNCAVCYRDGYGVEKNEVKALNHYEKLATSGYFVGFKEAAYCRLVGIGSGPDLEKALYWYFLWAKADGAKIFNDGLVRCMVKGDGNSELEREVIDWLNQELQTSQYGPLGPENMLAHVESRGNDCEVPAKHSAGIGWILDNEPMRRLFVNENL